MIYYSVRHEKTMRAVFPFPIRVNSCPSVVDYRIILAVASIQPARDSGAVKNFLRERAGFGSAVGEDAVHMIEVGGEFGALGAGRGEIIPVMLEQRFFQIAVTKSARAQAILKILRDSGRSHEFEQLNGDIFFRVGLWLGGSAAVHYDAHHFL